MTSCSLACHWLVTNYIITDTGPGKLTVGKLYGGILIYEIWKTTRFSNLEILAKMEQEMASKMENQITGTGDKCSNADKDSVKTVETQQMLDIMDEPGFVPDNNIDEELKEQYDQYNDDPNFNNKQREYYNQRSGFQQV